MTKNYCDKCEGNYRSKVALEEANEYLHGLREVFMFEELSEWAEKNRYNLLEVCVVNSFEKGEVKKLFKVRYAKLIGGKLEWITKSASSMDELYSLVMGNGSDDDEDLL